MDKTDDQVGLPQSVSGLPPMPAVKPPKAEESRQTILKQVAAYLRSQARPDHGSECSVCWRLRYFADKIAEDDLRSYREILRELENAKRISDHNEDSEQVKPIT
jgi:hypothetical protein